MQQHETLLTPHHDSTHLFAPETLGLWGRAVPNLQYLVGLICKLIRHVWSEVLPRKILIG